jgi:hypothetical protein
VVPVIVTPSARDVNSLVRDLEVGSGRLAEHRRGERRLRQHRGPGLQHPACGVQRGDAGGQHGIIGECIAL